MKCRHHVEDPVEEVMVYEEEIISGKQDEMSENRNCTDVWAVA